MGGARGPLQLYHHSQVILQVPLMIDMMFRFLYSPALEYLESVAGCRKFQHSSAYGPGSEAEYLEYR